MSVAANCPVCGDLIFEDMKVCRDCGFSANEGEQLAFEFFDTTEMEKVA